MPITTSHGFGPGLLAGSGYGKREDVTREADKLALALDEKYRLPIEKRGNHDGLSCGAYHRDFGVGARFNEKTETISFDAMFAAPKESIQAIKSNVPHSWIYEPAPYNDHGYVTAHSPQFQTSAEALNWLSEHGERYCQALMNR